MTVISIYGDGSKLQNYFCNPVSILVLRELHTFFVQPSRYNKINIILRRFAQFRLILHVSFSWLKSQWLEQSWYLWRDLLCFCKRPSWWVPKFQPLPIPSHSCWALPILCKQETKLLDRFLTSRAKIKVMKVLGKTFNLICFLSDSWTANVQANYCKDLKLPSGAK